MPRCRACHKEYSQARSAALVAFPVLASVQVPTPAKLDREHALSASAFIFSRLRADIMSGVFRPGERLPMKVLTSRYDSSVVPVREALSQLVGTGLVVQEAQRGYYVAPMSLNEFEDIAQTRAQIECLSLEQSIARGGDDWLRRVCKAQSRYAVQAEKVGDVSPITPEWERLHREFHITLTSACGSPMLIGFCDRLNDRFDRYRQLGLHSKGLLAGVVDGHDEVVGAITARDRSRAVAKLRDHILDTAAIVMAELEVLGYPREHPEFN